MSLLIHSMHEFRPLILDCLEIAGAKQVAEVGTEYGGMSVALAEWLQPRQGHLCCVDPSPKPEFLAWVERAAGVTHVPLPSLEALPLLPCMDAWLIDGDHNWYTVYSELTHIFAKCWETGKHPLIFLHDVNWPCARRDCYYAPHRIPAEFRKPHRFDAGAILGQPLLKDGRGFRGGRNFAFAEQEGGPRNGVLTAVEDVVTEQTACGHKLAWCFVPGVFGLGVLFDASAPWAGALIEKLLPWHENPLIAALEKNRLENYLQVIEMQDAAASTPAHAG